MERSATLLAMSTHRTSEHQGVKQIKQKWPAREIFAIRARTKLRSHPRAVRRLCSDLSEWVPSRIAAAWRIGARPLRLRKICGQLHPFTRDGRIGVQAVATCR